MNVRTEPTKPVNVCDSDGRVISNYRYQWMRIEEASLYLGGSNGPIWYLFPFLIVGSFLLAAFVNS